MWLLMAAVVGLYAVKRDSFQLGVYLDDAEYVHLAQSIAQDRPFRVLLSPEIELPSKYPAGWPLLLSWFGDVLEWRHDRLPVVSAVITILCVVLIVVLGSIAGIARREDVLIVAMLFGFSPLATSHAAMVMSEPAYLAVSLLALSALQQSLRSQAGALGFSVLTGGLIAFAILIRSIGVALVAAPVVAMLSVAGARERSWRVAAMVVGAAVLTSAIVSSTSIAWDDLAMGTNVYSREYGETRSRGVGLARATSIVMEGGEGLAEYATSIVRDALVPFTGGPSTRERLDRLGFGVLVPISGLSITLLIVLGMGVSSRASPGRACVAYVVCYIAVLVIWPWRGVRFAYPILPMLFAYLLVGSRMIVSRALRSAGAQRFEAVVLGLLVAVLCLLQVARSALIVDSREHVVDLGLGAEWIDANAPSDSMVLIEEPLTSIALYLGRPIAPLASRCGRTMPCDLRGADFVLVRPMVAWLPPGEHARSELGVAFATWADEHPGDVVRVFHDAPSRVSVYQVLEP